MLAQMGKHTVKSELTQLKLKASSILMHVEKVKTEMRKVGKNDDNDDVAATFQKWKSWKIIIPKHSGGHMKMPF